MKSKTMNFDLLIKIDFVLNILVVLTIFVNNLILRV